jgi:hypothetical protein
MRTWTGVEGSFKIIQLYAVHMKLQIKCYRKTESKNMAKCIMQALKSSFLGISIR